MWNSELLKRHFLHVRASEKQHVGEVQLALLLEELRDAYARYHSMVAAIPDLEAITRNVLPGLDYLTKWADGLG